MDYTTTQIRLNGRLYIVNNYDTVFEIWGKITGKGFPKQNRKGLRKAYLEFLHISRGFTGGLLEFYHLGEKLYSIELKHKL